MKNDELNKLREQHVVVLEKYQRLLKLLEMEQQNTQKYIQLFNEAQRENFRLKKQLAKTQAEPRIIRARHAVPLQPIFGTHTSCNQ